MPGPYIHISAMRHAASQLEAEPLYRPPGSDRIDPRWSGFGIGDVAALLRDNPNYAAIGAVGPDLFFFLPDFRDLVLPGGARIRTSSVLTGVLEFLESAYEFVDEHFLTKWEHYLGPISEDTAEAMSRLTGGLSEVVGDITSELGGILITILEDFLVSQRDWWEFFSLGLNQGFDEQAFFWSDMLHYRQTGEFGRTLWELANERGEGDGEGSPLATDGARSYALGYITHLATDVTGHAFVNQISGGPFRLHWQRHHLVENHMDASWYLADPLTPRAEDRYPEFTESAIYYDIAFSEDGGGPVPRPSYPTGRTMRENWERRRRLDIDSELADPIADLLIEAMGRVFYENGGPHPRILEGDGRPDADQVKEAYKLLFRYLKLSTADGFAHEPPPPPDLFPNLDFPTIGDPSDEPPGDDDDSFWDDLLDFLLSVIAAIAYVLEVIVWLLTLPWAILADIATYPLRLALYYTLELGLYHLLKNFRMVLVMTGYLHPMRDEIAAGLVTVGSSDRDAVARLFADIDDIFAGLGEPEVLRETYRDRAYPRQHPPDEFRHPWHYPWGEKTERDGTTAGPHHLLAPPDELFVDLAAEPQIRDALEEALGPPDADQAGRFIDPDGNLGDAVGFSKYLLWLLTRDAMQKNGDEVPITDWNLDADRGYGYQCWDWNRRAGHPIDDPEGNPFDEPCTWPSQAYEADEHPDRAWDADRRLLLHWTGPGLEDPGCDGGADGGGIGVAEPAIDETSVDVAPE
jgi:hypothetical protein